VFEWDWLNPREADRLLAEFPVVKCGALADALPKS
jgi:hypothetical protein